MLAHQDINGPTVLDCGTVALSLAKRVLNLFDNQYQSLKNWYNFGKFIELFHTCNINMPATHEIRE